MNSWRSRLLALVLLMMTAVAACSGKTEPAAGLELIVATNLQSPSDFDSLRLEVSQEVSPGQWGSPLIANDFRVPDETTLPTTFAIAAGKSADQNALIRVVALKGQRPVVLREAQIQIPRSRVAALTFVLSSLCGGKVKVDAAGAAQSTCADPTQSCQPETGECGSSVVDPATLPNYTPGDENGITVTPAVEAAAVDGAVDAPGEPPGAPSGVAADPIPVAYVVTTLAGSGVAGYADGTGAAASFNNPYGVALDAAGNVYVGDMMNHRIRKVTAAGVVTTLAGSGTAAFADGMGVAAAFNTPHGVALDAAGNVYVSDYVNNRIRKVTPTGVVTTLAGSGTATFADGTGAAASFSSPVGVATDAAGNVYVGDTFTYRLRKVTPVGVVTTLAGSSAGFADGTGSGAKFNRPQGTAVNAAGDVFLADTYNYRIRRVTSAGATTVLAGSGTIAFADGTGAAASFSHPSGVALDAAGNLYVSDQVDRHIRRVTPAGVVTTVAGSGAAAYADGTGSAASFMGPGGLAVDADGMIYVADSGIRKINPVGVGQLMVTWSAPTTAGSSAILGYAAKATAAGQPTRTCTATASASSCTITGLMSDVAYSVSVTANNAGGSGAPSASATATPN
jgi:sugar lactone lactonase YvrE